MRKYIDFKMKTKVVRKMFNTNKRVYLKEKNKTFKNKTKEKLRIRRTYLFLKNIERFECPCCGKLTLSAIKNNENLFFLNCSNQCCVKGKIHYYKTKDECLKDIRIYHSTDIDY